MVLSSIIASGLSAMGTKMDAHAHNIANARTPGYERLVPRTTERQNGGVDASVARENADVEGTDSRPAPEAGAADDGASSTDAPSAGSTPRDMAVSSSVRASSGEDLVEDMVGMREAALTSDALIAAYERESAALGSLFDAFG